MSPGCEAADAGRPLDIGDDLPVNPGAYRIGTIARVWSSRGDATRWVCDGDVAMTLGSS